MTDQGGQASAALGAGAGLPPAPAAGLRANPAYRRLWAADLVSQVGTQVTFLALPLTAVLTLRSGAWQLGLLRAAEYVPVLLALHIGLLADRRPRRRILLTADLAQAATLIALPVLHALGLLTIWPLLAVALVLGAFSLAFDITAQSFLPDVVGPDQLAQANAGLQLSNSAGQLAGPAVAALLIAAVTAPNAVLIDAASFAVSAALLFRIRARLRPPDAAPQRQASRARDGLRFVLAHPRLRPLALASALTGMALGISEALLILFAVRTLQVPVAAIGAIFTVGNAGILLGAACGPRLLRRAGLRRACVAGLALEVAGLALQALAPAGVLAIVVLACAGLLGTTGIIVYNISQVTARQRAAPAGLIGRVSAAARVASISGLLAGSLAGGLLGQVAGLRPALAVAAAITAAAVAVVWLAASEDDDGG